MKRKILTLLIFFSPLLVMAQAPYSGGEGSGYASATTSNVVLSALGINDNATLKFFPNPVKAGDKVFFEHPTKAFKIEVFDAKGIRVAVLENPENLNTTGFPAGIYFLRVLGSTHTSTQKLIVYE